MFHQIKILPIIGFSVPFVLNPILDVISFSQRRLTLEGPHVIKLETVRQKIDDRN